MSLRRSLIVLLSFIALVCAIMCVSTFSLNSGVSYAADVDETSENNNYFHNAMQFNVEDTVLGKLSSLGDIDWYKFDLDEKGKFSITFGHATVYNVPYPLWSVEVYKGMNYDASTSKFTDKYLLGSYEVYGRNTLNTAEFGVHEGTYFVCVKTATNRTEDHRNKDYRIYVNFFKCDDWEGERNDEKWCSEYINPNEVINGAITTETDEDWFDFRTTSRGVFYIDFKHFYVTDNNTRDEFHWNIYLYDKNGNFIDGYESKYSVYGRYDVCTPKFGVDAGKYYVRITKGDSYYSSLSYNFKVCFTETNDWETENNNAKSKADQIAVNTTVNGTTTNILDYDYYTFTLTEKGFFYIDFKHEPLMNSYTFWKIRIFDSEGNEVDGVENGYNAVSGEEDEKTGVYGVDVGAYYILISGGKDRFSTVDYNFKVCFTASNEWETENNNLIEYSDTFVLNAKINGALTTKGDVDWFTFDVQNDTKVQVFFNHQMISQEKECWTCILYNDRLDILYKASFSGNSEKSVSDYIDLSVGKYYFKIIEADKGKLSNATYSITTIEYHDHVGEWVITDPPTCTETGIETNTCTICGHQETRDVDALGHDYQKHVATESKLFKFGEIEYICSRCGDKYSEKDKSKLWLAVTVIAFAISTVGGGIYAIVAAAKGKNIFK